MNALPCRLCGYDAPDATCPHCSHQSTAPSLCDTRMGWANALIDGLRAVPQGLFILVSTPGVKRFLIPPVILTAVAFGVLMWWTMGLVDLLVEAVEVEDMAELGLEEGWFKVAVVWLIEKGIATTLAKISGVFLWVVVSSVVVLYTFSIVYEAVAGPFLDEIQGRVEMVWFGNNPRDNLERPSDIPVARCVRLTLIASAASLVLLVVLWSLSLLAWWIALPVSCLPFIAAGQIDHDYGNWLMWVVRVEGHTLWVSIKASLSVLVILVMFIWVKFLPLIGFPLFMAIAGFGTAITLLDIPFSRRSWSLTKRLQFMTHNFLAMTAFGIVSSLVFLVPVLGPIVMVPAASIGGLWLVVRLDKDSLRPPELRRSSTER
jgi:uncharacterized protein involved in cysteine biosynthesis